MHPGMPGVTMRSSGSSEAKARVPKQRRSPPSETGNSVCLGILRYANNLKSPNVIRHQGGAQGRASESITRGAAKDAQRHAHAFLFLAHHGLSKHPHTVLCRSVHSNFSHLRHNAAYPAEIAWQYSYSRLGIREEREDYQLALTEPGLKRKCIPQNLSCLQRPDQTHWQQTQTPDSTGSWCNAFPDITVSVTRLASCDMQPFSLSDNTWARVFPMDPDPKSRQRRRPPSRFRKGHVPLRLWTPQDPERGIRLEQEREHSQQVVTQRNLEQEHRRRREQWDTHKEAGSWWSGWTNRHWSYWSWDEYGTSWSEADWRDNRAVSDEARPRGSSSSGTEPAALALQRLAAHPVEPIVEDELVH